VRGDRPVAPDSHAKTLRGHVAQATHRRRRAPRYPYQPRCAGPPRQGRRWTTGPIPGFARPSIEPRWSAVL